MKKVWMLLLLVVGSVAAMAQGEEALVQAVKAKLDKVQDYQASGRMKIDVAFIKAPVSGVVAYYKKPDKFRIKRTGGISILPKGGVSISVNSLLFADNFAAVGAGTSVVKGITTRVVKLLPLDEGSDIALTTLYIDDKNLLIRRAAITTRESGSYEIELDYGKYGTYGLPDKVVFSFNTKDYKLPKGITLEYESGKKPKEAPKSRKGRVEITYTGYAINKGVSDAVFKE